MPPGINRLRNARRQSNPRWCAGDASAIRWPRIVSPQSYLIGRGPFVPSGVFYGSVNVVAVMVWTRVLSDAEMAAAYAQLSILFADQGLPVRSASVPDRSAAGFNGP